MALFRCVEIIVIWLCTYKLNFDFKYLPLHKLYSFAQFQVWNLDKKSSLLNALPMNHTYGIVSSLLAPMSVGGRVVMMDKFDAVRVSSTKFSLV